MSKENLLKLKNCDIYYLLLTYFLIFLFGPLAGAVLVVAWLWAILRHRDRSRVLDEMLKEYEEKNGDQMAKV